MLDYTIPVLQFILREGSSQLEFYESSEVLSYDFSKPDRPSYLAHQEVMGETNSCRIVAFPVSGMANEPAHDWGVFWFRNGTLPGDVRVSVLRGFEADEEEEPGLMLERLALGGWSIDELIEGELDPDIYDEKFQELREYCEDVTTQPDWADDIMESTDAAITEIITNWQATNVIDLSRCMDDCRLDAKEDSSNIFYVIDSDERRLPTGTAVQLTAGPGVTLCCFTQHNIMAETGSTIFVYGPTSLLMEAGSAAYVANGRSVVTLGECDLMVLRDAGQIHCFGEKPTFKEVRSIVL